MAALPHSAVLRNRLNGMVRRCYDPRHLTYKRYGAKGICVCAEWRRDFNAFYRWAMEHGFTPELQIDRKDSLKDYSPENCRLVTLIEQHLFKRVSKASRFPGVTRKKGRWVARIRINGSDHKYIGLFDTEEEAGRAYAAAVKRHHGVDIFERLGL